MEVGATSARNRAPEEEKKNETRADLDATSLTVSPSGFQAHGARFPSLNQVEEAMRKNQELPNNVPPFLRVRERINNWEAINANATILRVIRTGLRVPLKEKPAPRAPRTRGDVSKELTRLKELGVVRDLTPTEIKTTRVWTPVFTVPKKGSDKVRLITDLRFLNALSDPPTFAYPSWNAVGELVGQKGVCAKIDIEDYFFHVGLHNQTSRWVRIPPGVELLAMPFGLSSSPYWASRLARPAIAELTRLGVRLVWYVDDILVINPTSEGLVEDLLKVVGLLTALGFRINQRKSILTPSTQVEFLGMQVNTENGTISLDNAKLKEHRHATSRLINDGKASAKALASVAGALNYAARGHADLMGWPRALMREAGITAKTGWNKPKLLSESANKILNRVKGILTKQSPVNACTQAKPMIGELFTDASDQGWGAVFVPHNSRTAEDRSVFHGRWTQRQATKHITCRETLAVLLGLTALGRAVHLDGAELNILTDSIAARAAVQKGSARYGQNELGAAIRKKAEELHVNIKIKHVAGTLNLADEPSRRSRDKEDYQIIKKWLSKAINTFQIEMPKVDLFAARHNSNARNYYAERLDGGTGQLGVNALETSWSAKDGLYANPPWTLLNEVIKKVADDKATLVLVAPVWRTARWWNTLERLTVKKFDVPKGEPVYRTETRAAVPPPRWSTTIRLLSAARKQAP